MQIDSLTLVPMLYQWWILGKQSLRVALIYMLFWLPWKEHILLRHRDNAWWLKISIHIEQIKMINLPLSISTPHYGSSFLKFPPQFPSSDFILVTFKDMDLVFFPQTERSIGSPNKQAFLTVATWWPQEEPEKRMCLVQHKKEEWMYHLADLPLSISMRFIKVMGTITQGPHKNIHTN